MGFPVRNSPQGLCGRKATLNLVEFPCLAPLGLGTLSRRILCLEGFIIHQEHGMQLHVRNLEETQTTGPKELRSCVNVESLGAV